MNETSRGLGGVPRGDPPIGGYPAPSPIALGQVQEDQLMLNADFPDPLNDNITLSRLLSGDTVGPWDLDSLTSSSPSAYRPWECDLGLSSPNSRSFSLLGPPNVLAPNSGERYSLLEQRLPSFQSQFQETTGAFAAAAAAGHQAVAAAAVAAVASPDDFSYHQLQPCRQPKPVRPNAFRPVMSSGSNGNNVSSVLRSSLSASHPLLSAQLRSPPLRTPSSQVSSSTGLSRTEERVKKKRKRCGECVGCQKKDNCGNCAPCRNDKSHQICKLRRCDMLTEKKPRKPSPPKKATKPNETKEASSKRPRSRRRSDQPNSTTTTMVIAEETTAEMSPSSPICSTPSSAWLQHYNSTLNTSVPTKRPEARTTEHFNNNSRAQPGTTHQQDLFQGQLNNGAQQIMMQLDAKQYDMSGNALPGRPSPASRGCSTWRPPGRPGTTRGGTNCSPDSTTPTVGQPTLVFDENCSFLDNSAGAAPTTSLDRKSLSGRPQPKFCAGREL